MGDETPSRDPPTVDEVDALVSDLFGDFDDDEGPPPAESGSSAPSGQKTERDEEQGQGEERPLKQRRTDAAKFFDTEAVEAGAGDEEDDFDVEDLIDDSAPTDSKAQAGQKAELERLQHEIDEREFSGAAMRGSGFLDQLEEKYRQSEDMEDKGMSIDEIGVVVPSQPVQDKSGQLTVTVPDPSRDPRLWCVKTFGPERELCLSVLLKASSYYAMGKLCPIYSVFFNPALRGYIYVEAHKDNEIREFTKGIRGISPWAIRLVPVGQMPQVLASAVADSDMKETLNEGDWVRMKRPAIYDGDLARIDEIRDDMYSIRLKPRLDMTVKASKKGGGRQDRSSAQADRAARKRPAARWFNRGDCDAAGIIVNEDRRLTKHGYQRFFFIDGEVYRDGFLHKTVKKGFFVAGEEVRPTEHELQDWRNVPVPSPMTTPEKDLKKAKISAEELEEKEALDRKMMPPPVSIPKPAALQQRMDLEKEDIVIVTHGDLMHMKGVVEKAFPGGVTVLVRPMSSEGIKEDILTVQIDRLSKYFEIGDFARAYLGPHAGLSGYVVKVHLKDDGGPKWAFGATVTLVALNGPAAKEFRVLVNHLRISVERSEPVRRHGEFGVGQIVSVNGTVGLITRIEPTSHALYLDCSGQVRVAGFAELVPISDHKGRGRGGQSEFWTTDRRGKRIIVGDIVNAPGAASGKSLPIKSEIVWIHGTHVFVKAVEGLVGERAYMVVSGEVCQFVVRNAMIAEKMQMKKDLVARKMAEQEVEKELSMDLNPFRTEIKMGKSTAFLSDKKKQQIAKDLMARGLPFDVTKPMALSTKGTTVKITGGSYKGLRAEVRDVLGEKVRLSLLAKPKLVDVPIEKIQPDEYTPKGRKVWLDAIEDKEKVKQINYGEEYMPVPKTPEASYHAVVVPPSPGSNDADDQALAILREAGDLKKDDELEAIEWNPNFGMPIVDPALNTELVEPAQGTPSTDPTAEKVATVSPASPVIASVSPASGDGAPGSRKGRRAARLPGTPRTPSAKSSSGRGGGAPRTPSALGSPAPPMSPNGDGKGTTAIEDHIAAMPQDGIPLPAGAAPEHGIPVPAGAAPEGQDEHARVDRGSDPRTIDAPAVELIDFDPAVTDRTTGHETDTERDDRDTSSQYVASSVQVAVSGASGSQGGSAHPSSAQPSSSAVSKGSIHILEAEPDTEFEGAPR